LLKQSTKMQAVELCRDWSCTYFRSLNFIMQIVFRVTDMSTFHINVVKGNVEMLAPSEKIIAQLRKDAINFACDTVFIILLRQCSVSKLGSRSSRKIVRLQKLY
jgi:hypothetical protein